MANMNDYLDWRGDIPFSIDPFNEADNIILSQLAYVDFENISDLDISFRSVRDVRDEYFTIHTRDEIRARKTPTALAPLLLDKLYDSKRFEDLKLGYYITYLDKNTVSQFAAITYQINDFTYVAFRGTDNTLIGWKEDFYLSYRTGINSQKAAAAYMDHLFNTGNSPLHLGGHSKGGNLAIYAACSCKKSIRDRIQKVWSNDGPGFHEEMQQSDSYLAMKNKIELIIPESSVIGILMNDLTPKIIKSSASSIQQHDAMTWMIIKNHFVEADALSTNSQFLNKAIDSWLSMISDQDAKVAIDSVFSVLESTDAETFVSLSEGGMRSAKEILRAAGKLPPEKQMIILRLLGKFILNSGSLLYTDYMDKTQEQFNKLLEKYFNAKSDKKE